jgi:hypothetical protein
MRIRLRLRTLMLAVAAAALLLWAAMMGVRSYVYARRARAFAAQEQAWRQIGARSRGWTKAAAEIADYYALLARKYHRAARSPWRPVGPDPPAPGVRDDAAVSPPAPRTSAP